MADIAQGLANLNRKLTKAIPERVYNQVRTVLAAQADKIVAQMKRHAPVDSGDLQMSISWCWGNAPKGTMTIGRVTTGGGKGSRTFKQGKNTTGLRISIFAGGGDEFYAWFQEFGTQNMPAHPFFYPIYRANKRAAKAAITRAISKGLKDGAKA
ncbi:HK97-gp10 family putative phage morphogenesis protein [Mesorhizobium sp. 128a]